MATNQDEIHKKSLSDNEDERIEALNYIESNFESLPGESVLWDDLHKLTNDNDFYVRSNAAYILIDVFSSIPDKYKSVALNDLHKLTTDEKFQIRCFAAEILGYNFSCINNKDTAWADLHKLTRDKSLKVRAEAAFALGCAFRHIPDKDSAWMDLHELTGDQKPEVRRSATEAFGFAFLSIPEEYKSVAYNDLHRLTIDESKSVRTRAALALGFIFSDITSEQKTITWEKLYRLAKEDDFIVKKWAIAELAFVFSLVPDKNTAWNNLHQLTLDKDSSVRQKMASTLSQIFAHASYKSAVLEDLHRLANDENSDVRLNANHSLGKIFIHKASMSEDEVDSRNLLENAILYFEKAANEPSYSNPAKFCSLFYRSFDAVIFKKVASKNEIENYIVDAREEIRSSKSKAKLLDAVEKLAEVLETAQNARETDIEYKELLTQCSSICNQVDGLMEENKEKTPAIFELYRKNRPSFDKTIKELIENVKKKAENVCKDSKGGYKDLACAINQNVKSINEETYDDFTIVNQKLDSILNIARGKILLLPDLADIDEDIEIALQSDSAEQKSDAIYEILKRIPRDTSDSSSRKWIAAIGIGGTCMASIALLFASDPYINYVAFMAGLIIAGLTYYLMS